MPNMRKSIKMSRILRCLLLKAVKEAGSYNPEQVLFRIEESLTGDEYRTAESFLKWVGSNGLMFGSGNIDARFQEFSSQKV